MGTKILIGGQALRNLGSDRYTDDVDYLINDTNSNEMFIHTSEADFLNANGNKFFAEVYENEKNNEQASAQGLFELKVYSFVQHCQNFNWKKVDSAEYDIKFLVRNFGITESKIARKYISQSEFLEIQKIINSVKK